MDALVIYFCAVLFVSFLLCVVHMFIDYAVHIDMNKNEHCPYDFVSFSTFIKEFNKYKNNPRLDIQDDKSLFLREYNQYIVYLYASIVKFNDKCMIFYPISWVKYCIWKKKFIKQNKKKNTGRCKGLWKAEN